MTEYRTDIEYKAGYNKFQAPTVFNYVAALNGVPPLALDQPFTYCDLGCGVGNTLTALASVHPAGQFVGIDLNPSHIRIGQANAERLGVTNIRFVEANIADLADPGAATAHDLPPFDFLAINGLFSWLTPERREQAIDFIGHALKPGGFAYLHYMSNPANLIQAPICRLLQEYYHQLDGDREERVLLTKEFLRNFRNSQKRYFQSFPGAQLFIDRVLSSPVELFLHDYMNTERHAFYFGDLNDEMVARGCRFVGTTDFFMNHLQLCVPSDGRSLFQGVRDRVGLERIKDFALVPGGRKDVFRKDGGPVAPADVDLLEGCAFGAALTVDTLSQPVTFPGGAVPLNSAPYSTIEALLNQAPLTLAELYARPELAAVPRADIRRAVTQLVAGNRIEPFANTRATAPPRPEAGAEPLGDMSAYNATILRDAVLNGAPSTVAAVTLTSSLWGSALNLKWTDAAIAVALLEQPGPRIIPWIEDLFRPRSLALHAPNTKASPTSTREHLLAALPQIHQTLSRLLGRVDIATLPPLDPNFRQGIEVPAPSPAATPAQPAAQAPPQAGGGMMGDGITPDDITAAVRDLIG